MGEKGLSEAAADRIGELVAVQGEPREVLAQLTAEGSAFMTHPGAAAALAACGTLFEYLDAMGSLGALTFDLSLARGLDYYTGVIYEAVLTDPEVGVGSIAAGGRYDGLVGQFSPSGTPVPCVGVSIGIERVFTIMEARAKAANAGRLAKPVVSVLVASQGEGLVAARLRLCAALWAAGLSAETVYAEAPKLKAQLNKALADGIPYMVVIGEAEAAAGTAQVKRLNPRSERIVPQADIAAELLKLGAPLTGVLPPATSDSAGTGAGAGAAAPPPLPAAPAE